MLTNVYMYNEINRLVFHITSSLILSPLLKQLIGQLNEYFSA